MVLSPHSVVAAAFMSHGLADTPQLSQEPLSAGRSGHPSAEHISNMHPAPGGQDAAGSAQDAVIHF